MLFVSKTAGLIDECADVVEYVLFLGLASLECVSDFDSCGISRTGLTSEDFLTFVIGLAEEDALSLDLLPDDAVEDEIV